MTEPVDIFSLTSQYTTDLEMSEPGSDESPDETSPSQFLADSFRSTLSEKLEQVEEDHRTAQDKVREFAAGKIDNVHDVTVALQKARMSLGLTTLVRSKFLEAWQQIQNLQ